MNKRPCNKRRMKKRYKYRLDQALKSLERFTEKQSRAFMDLAKAFEDAEKAMILGFSALESLTPICTRTNSGGTDHV
ncbi:hypothetical protein L0152_07415 [bacterium]|nr:hypothetical protein [bacterium]